MDQSPSFIEKLRNDLRTQAKAVADTISYGKCRNFPEYQKMCGVIEGFERALDIIEANVKQLVEED